tara:strand:- start:3564 stop:7250 length:3687 start_codon:yes stop_codon:yes gene_type:complete
MGRPNQCDPCCGDIGDPPDPPISQCDDVICIALIDENEKSVSNGGTFAGRDQMAVAHPLFRAAYPNRLLFVLDCFSSSNTMYYSQSFLDDPLAFSLRVEFDDSSGPAGLIRLLARDNGDNAIATANNPWGRILAIKEHYPSVKAIFDAASEISIFVDDSGSLQGETQMEATIIKLKADAISSGYTNANPTPNNKEDIICPFAQSQCCTDNAQPLMDECGVNVNCGALSLSFIKSPDDALIREYCTNIFLPNSPFYIVCGCISQQEEQEANTIEYTALATNSQGQNAEHVEIRYSLQASDNGTDWVTIENLDNGFSGTQQALNALIDNWGGSSLDPDDCHQWLSDNGEWNQLGSDIEGEAANDACGWSVSLNAAGDRVAVGGYKNNEETGHVRIFEWNGSSWNQLGSDIDGEKLGDGEGYSVSLNATGNRVAIGAPFADVLPGNANCGRTRIFEWNGVNWVQVGSNIFGGGNGDQSGRSVSLNAAGDIVAIGAPLFGVSNNGATQVFQWDGINWVQLGSNITGDTTNGFSGWSVSLNSLGNRVAIGARGQQLNPGQAKVYEWNGSFWDQLGSTIDGINVSDQNGYSVSLNADGDRVAIGAPKNDDGGTSSGQTRIFDWNGVSWTQTGRSINGESFGDNSGYSVSLNAAGDRVAIGAPYNDDAGAFAGHVRIFKWDGNIVWEQVGSDIDGESSNDFSGWSVSLNSAGDLVAIGAPSFNNARGIIGHARVFNIDSTTTGACLLYQDIASGNCDRRIWTRQFRIKAETIGYPLTAFSDTFKIYELRSRSGTSYFTADGEWVGGAGYGDGITLNPQLPLGGSADEIESNFGDSVFTVMGRGYNSSTDTYFPNGHYWATDPLYRRIWKMTHEGDGSRSPFDASEATRFSYPASMVNPYIGCDGHLYSNSYDSSTYYYNPNSFQSISSTTWQVLQWAYGYSYSFLGFRNCSSVYKGATVYLKSGRTNSSGWGFFINGPSVYDLDSNVIITPNFQGLNIAFSYKEKGTRRWYDVFLAGYNSELERGELRYYKLWLDSASVAEFGQLSLISTLLIEEIFHDMAVDFYSYNTIDDTDVFEQQGGYIRISTVRDNNLQVIYYFGGDDWRKYSADISSSEVQSELYPEKAADGNYLYVPNLGYKQPTGNGRFILKGEVYNLSENKYYPGIFVMYIEIGPDGNTIVGRYGKPVASFVENDGFGRHPRRADATWVGLVVGAPTQEALNGGGAVYYYMWTPNR